MKSALTHCGRELVDWRDKSLNPRRKKNWKTPNSRKRFGSRTWNWYSTTRDKETEMSDVKDSTATFEEALAKAEEGKYILFLYVAGMGPK